MSAVPLTGPTVTRNSPFLPSSGRHHRQMHCAYPQRNGQAEFTLVAGWLPGKCTREWVSEWVVARLYTRLAQCNVTSFMCIFLLLLLVDIDWYRDTWYYCVMLFTDFCTEPFPGGLWRVFRLPCPTDVSRIQSRQGLQGVLSHTWTGYPVFCYIIIIISIIIIDLLCFKQRTARETAGRGVMETTRSNQGSHTSLKVLKSTWIF